MKVRRHAPALLIATATIVVATLTLVSNAIFSGMSTAVEREQLEVGVGVRQVPLGHVARLAAAVARELEPAQLPVAAARHKDGVRRQAPVDAPRVLRREGQR